MSDEPRCPCGSGSRYAECCEPIHRGGDADTAERLMRSRYSAFARGLPAYLRRSWHPSTRPDTVELDEDTAWRRLQIVDTVAGGRDDDTGIVEFRAAFRSGGRAGLLHERSRFARESGRWVYLDGVLLE